MMICLNYLINLFINKELIEIAFILELSSISIFYVKKVIKIDIRHHIEIPHINETT